MRIFERGFSVIFLRVREPDTLFSFLCINVSTTMCLLNGSSSRLRLFQTNFVRQKTPHPKELKAKAHKLFGSTNGKVQQQQQPHDDLQNEMQERQQPENNGYGGEDGNHVDNHEMQQQQNGDEHQALHRLQQQPQPEATNEASHEQQQQPKEEEDESEEVGQL